MMLFFSLIADTLLFAIDYATPPPPLLFATLFAVIFAAYAAAFRLMSIDAD